jgi:hypothetical protein
MEYLLKRPRWLLVQNDEGFDSTIESRQNWFLESLVMTSGTENVRNELCILFDVSH